MNELQLVGYTADLRFLVFTAADDGSVRFKAPVDEDLLATMDEVTNLVDPDRRAPPSAPAPTPVTPQPAAPPAGQGPLAVAGLLAQVALSPHEVEEPPASRESKLSPREIQALLRAGKAPAVVARMAETDEAWVERWLAPIEAERAEVLRAVQQARLAKSRLGPSRDVVGEAVRRNLSAKGVRPDDPSVEWRVSRRDGTESWTVELRYRSRGRRQRAVWAFDQETGSIEPRNDLALEVGWTRSRRTAPAEQAVVSKKAAARRTTTAKKATAKKATAKKATAKKATARKATAKGTTAKRGTVSKTGARKATATKAGGSTREAPGSGARRRPQRPAR